MTEPWLVKENLEKWLNIVVKEIRVEDDNTKNAYFCSSIKRLKVIAENGDEYPLFVKCRLEEGPVAEMFRETAIFRKEQEIYGNTLNKMNEIYREAYPDATESFAPQCYYACESFLLMEDLSVSGFKVKDKMEGLDLEHSLLVLRTLAKFNATSLVLLERYPDAFAKFDVGFFEELAHTHKNFVLGMAKTLADEIETWTEEWHKFAPKLRAAGNIFVDLVLKVTHRREEDFNVLIHGDLWTNNMMFQDKAAAIRLVDFQMAHYSSIALDLHYFLVGSTTVEVRTKHWDLLLQEYYKTLIQTLKALGYKKDLLTMEEFLKEFNKKAVWGLYTLVVPYGVMQCDPNCGFSFAAAIERAETPGPSMYGENYKKTVKLLLPFYDSKGVFSDI